MASGDYYLQKNNGTTIDEKIFTAVAGKAIGFDASLNPVLLAVSLIGHTHTGYLTGTLSTYCIPVMGPTSLINSRLYDDGTTFQIGLSNTIGGTGTVCYILGSDNTIENTAPISNNFIIGVGTSLYGLDTIIVGSASYANGQFNYIFGGNCQAEGNNNTIIGQSSSIGGDNSVVIGGNANSYGSNSVCIGIESYVANHYGFAIGRSAAAGGPGDFALGRGAQVSTSTEPSMMLNVGNYGSTPLAQGNTLAIMGGSEATLPFYVGINTIIPTHMLHVNGSMRADEYIVDAGTGLGGITAYASYGANWLQLTNLNEDTGFQASMVFEASADDEKLIVAFQGPNDQITLFGSKYNRTTTPYFRTVFGDNSPAITAVKSILEFYASGNLCMSFDTTLSAPIKLYYAMDTNSQISSSLAQGSAPLAVVSTTLCTNLNADLLDGYHASAFSLSGHTHTYDNFVSWDISANSGTASQIYKTGSASSYKGVNFVGSGNVTVSTNSNANGFINVNISGSASYTHPAYTVFNPTLTGALVLATLTTDAIGSVTAVTTRSLTLANLGFIGATNATYFTGHTIYLNGASLVTIGSGGYLNVVATNAAGDPVVTLTGNAGAYRYDISVGGIPNCTLTGYTEGSTGALAATDTLKAAFSKLSATVPIVLNVTADTTTSSLTAVAVLTSGTLPAGTYIIDVAILAISSTSAGCRYSISNTGTATGYCTAQGATANLVSYAQEAFNINTLSSQYYAVGPNYLVSVTITAIIVLTTSGTISFNHAKYTSGTSTVKAHSYMRIQRKQ